MAEPASPELPPAGPGEVSILIDGRPVVDDGLAKLMLASDRLRLKRDDGLSVLIATPYEDGEVDAAAATLARFAADMEPAIARAIEGVGRR